MKSLKNWDNKTWLSSTRYISSFKNFLRSQAKINKNLKILDIGCGRANIISYLHKRYKFKFKPIGIDIVKNRGVKRNIIFKKIDAIKYLKKKEILFDLILIKQTIHFFKKKELNTILNLVKKNVATGGKVFIFSLKTHRNELPTFSKMKQKLDVSLHKSKYVTQTIKNNFVRYKKSEFKFQVLITKKNYIEMIKKRYISSLLDFSKKEIDKGVNEIQSKYKKNIKFDDILDCLVFQN
ncbi:class I SAM-dependent methyltransferase [Pelagibacteraceae bacterium]|nr:class I SAM-dependent methyltransferase [Pelagibacteraceae bacterium]|tara:strand:+ start:2113 stop:2823 length:711 start_codon:yes stop_codon:yes gene_type:complete